MRVGHPVDVGVSIMDTAATAAFALGVSLDGDVDGKVVEDAFGE